MTLRSQSINNTENTASNTPAASGSRPTVNVWVGKVGLSIDALQVEGMNKLGRPITVPEINPAIDYEEIMSGGVKGFDYSIPLQVSMELPFVFDQPRLAAKWLSLGTNIDLVFNYKEETTISSATRTSATVASATGLGKNDIAIIDTRHATYSGLLEMVTIKSVSGTAVTWDPPLDHVPADGTTFKTVVGVGSGTTQADTGIKSVLAVNTEHPRVCMAVDIYFPGNRSKIILFFPEVEVRGGAFNPSGNMATFAVTFKPIQQDEETFTLADGTTEPMTWYGKGYLVPING